MRQVRIIVEQPLTSRPDHVKEYFRRCFEIPDDVAIDYNVIESGVKALFRDLDNLVLTFKIINL